MKSAAGTYLVILKNGPIHSLDDYVAYQLEALSNGFSGELWVTGSIGASARIGNFTANVVKQPDNSSGQAWLRQYVPRVMKSMAELQRQNRQVVIISYDPFKNGLLGCLIKRRHRWPLILEVNGAYANPDNYADSGRSLANWIKPAAFKMLARRTLARADGVRLLYKEQLDRYATPPDSAVVRSYFDAVPLDRFPPAPEEPFLLHVGYPFKRKGVDLLLRAFAGLRQDFPHWKLVIIGHDLARHVGEPPENVVVMKAMHNREIAQWVSRCGCYVLASRSEAMGRVLLEAAAAQKARVAAKVDGTYTVVDDGKDGLLFEKGNAADLEKKLRLVMGDEKLRHALGAAARARALRNFSGERYLEHVSELVGSVLAAQAN